MKINKKVLIPLFATAMGLSAIGGVSGAVAWYQYNTKVSGSWVGVSTADGGVLQIKEGSSWVRDAEYGDGSDVLHPITFGAMTKTSALPGDAYKHPHAGVAAMTDWDPAVASDYVQFTVELQALKLNSSNGAYEPTAAVVKLDEMVISAVTTNKTDVGAALRVHITDGTVSHLFSAAGGSINTHGNLDLDKDTVADVVGGYKAFDDYDTTPIDYGDNGVQVSNSVSELAGSQIFEIGSTGTTSLTVTIWLEGWQPLRGSSIWDATKDSGSTFHFGMKLSTPKTTFLAD